MLYWLLFTYAGISQIDILNTNQYLSPFTNLCGALGSEDMIKYKLSHNLSALLSQVFSTCDKYHKVFSTCKRKK